MGGGSKGAYETGVIWGFNHNGDPSDFEWDVLEGISVGAVNAAAMGVWDKSDGVEMSEWLSNMWNNTYNPDIWVPWPGGARDGLTSEPSIVDSSPMWNFINDTYKAFDFNIKRISIVGTTDVNTGEYKTYLLNDSPPDLVALRAASSAAVPAVFTPIKIDGGVNIDGGAYMGVDPISAVA